MIEMHDATSGTVREIVDWQAGSPIYAGDEIPTTEPASITHGPFFWVLKPGDLVCDWLGVAGADNRGLLRLFINLALYSKIIGVVALFFY